MSKLGKRLLIFFIGIPVVLGIVYFKFLNHLPLQIAIGAISVLAADELYNMIAKKNTLFKKSVVLICTALQSFCAYILILFNKPVELCLWIFILEAIILMIISIFSNDFNKSVEKISYSIFIIFYTGFLITFLSRMTALNNSRYWIALFLINVFMCDSFAWFFGILFGKNNKGIFAASPNKSIAGFIGGIFGATACVVAMKFIFKDIFVFDVWKFIVLAVLTSFAAIIGDLIESVIKRYADCKDSGNIIPGRGGVLDSLDSVLIAAPVFYACIYIFFGISA